MPDLADKLAAAITSAISRGSAVSGVPFSRVRSDLTEALREILSTDLPEWYAGYAAAQEDAAKAAAVGVAPAVSPTWAERVVYGVDGPPESGDVLERSTCRHCGVPVSLLYVDGGEPIWNHDPEGVSRYAPCWSGWPTDVFAEPEPDDPTPSVGFTGPSGTEPVPAPAVLQHWIRDDGALVLSIKPTGEELASRPVVVYLGDDVIADDTAPPPEDPPLVRVARRWERQRRLNDERFGDYGPSRGPS